MSNQEGSPYSVSIGTFVFDPADLPAARRHQLERPPGSPDPNDTRIVQFHGPLGRSDKARLKEKYGLALTAYLPNRAYVERVDADTRRRLGREPLVRAVSPYPAEAKLDARLTALLDDGDDLGSTRIVASLFDGGSLDVVAKALEQAGGIDIDIEDMRSAGGTAYVAFTSVDRRVIEQACRLPDIRWLEPAAGAKEDDVAAAAVIQSGSDDNTAVWDRGLHGEGQVIAITEFGTPDINHCFFDDPDSTTTKVLSVRRSRVRDHATFAAGIALGDEGDNSGGHPNRGTAWAAQLVAVRLRRSGGNVRMGDLLAQLNRNRNDGATVHSNSWHDDAHGPGVAAPYNYVAVETDTFLWDNEEHVVLGSSGNNTEEQGAPGTAKNALCISASDADGTDVDDGNPGPTADGRRKPDLVAVGCGIRSATNGTDCDVESGGCATSWATPNAAGAAALVRQYFTEGWWAGGAKNDALGVTPTGALIRAVMVNSAVNMTGESGYPSNTQGWGILRLDRGLMFGVTDGIAGNGRNLVVRDIRNEFGLETGEEWTQGYTVRGGESQLRVVMAYTDPPATAGATNTLVNDLDLEVTSPDGTVFVGNDFDTSTGLSRARTDSSQTDSNNTIEVVLINGPAAGAWEIKVKATDITSDPQGFAIATTATNMPRDFSGCFVATAVYGDAEHCDVMALRHWRREMLDRGGLYGFAMRAFSTAYQRLGPPAATLVGHISPLRRVLRGVVFPRLVPALTRTGRTGRSRRTDKRSRAWA